MTFLDEPAFWALFVAALSASATPSMLRKAGGARLVSLLSVWSGATATTGLLYGSTATLISAALSITAGIVLLIASLILSGLKSMPNKRFEKR
jgi:hypothetical protein